jgi:hypothetical protein
MYKCHISKDIFPCNPETADKIPAPAYLYYECELPFPPYIGLELSNDEWSSASLISVRWDIESESFYCRVKEEFPWEDLAIGSSASFKELIDWAVRDNWVLANPNILAD